MLKFMPVLLRKQYKINKALSIIVMVHVPVAMRLMTSLVSFPLVMHRVAWVGKIMLLPAVMNHWLVMTTFESCILAAIYSRVHPWMGFIDHYFVGMI